jgi:hypothetical protein
MGLSRFWEGAERSTLPREISSARKRFREISENYRRALMRFGPNLAFSEYREPKPTLVVGVAGRRFG